MVVRAKEKDKSDGVHIYREGLEGVSQQAPEAEEGGGRE